VAEKIERHFAGRLSDKAIAVWGLAFKPGTDEQFARRRRLC